MKEDALVNALLRPAVLTSLTILVEYVISLFLLVGFVLKEIPELKDLGTDMVARILSIHWKERIRVLVHALGNL